MSISLLLSPARMRFRAGCLVAFALCVLLGSSARADSYLRVINVLSDPVGTPLQVFIGGAGTPLLDNLGNRICARSALITAGSHEVALRSANGTPGGVLGSLMLDVHDDSNYTLVVTGALTGPRSFVLAQPKESLLVPNKLAVTVMHASTLLGNNQMLLLGTGRSIFGRESDFQLGEAVGPWPANNGNVYVAINAESPDEDRFIMRATDNGRYLVILADDSSFNSTVAYWLADSFNITCDPLNVARLSGENDGNFRLIHFAEGARSIRSFLYDDVTFVESFASSGPWIPDVAGLTLVSTIARIGTQQRSLLDTVVNIPIDTLTTYYVFGPSQTRMPRHTFVPTPLNITPDAGRLWLRVLNLLYSGSDISGRISNGGTVDMPFDLAVGNAGAYVSLEPGRYNISFTIGGSMKTYAFQTDVGADSIFTLAVADVGFGDSIGVYRVVGDSTEVSPIPALTGGVSAVPRPVGAHSASRIIPNPASDRVTIALSGRKGGAIRLELIGALGSSALSLDRMPCASGECHIEIDVRPLVAGVYQLVVHEEEGSEFLGCLVVIH